MKLNMHWPSTPTNDNVAWYVIIYRAPFIVLAYVGLSLTWVGCLFMYRKSHADNWWMTATRY